MNRPAIELRGLNHRYDVEPVLRDIDLMIEHGEIFGFLGHNGAGKTTAINILTTLIEPTSGTAEVCGFDVVTERRDLTRCIGYLPAEVRMYGHMTAAENLEFFAKLSGVAEPRKAVAETLDRIPGGLFKALTLDRNGETEILKRFTTYENIRTWTEEASLAKHYERFAFAMTDVKERYRPFSLPWLLGQTRNDIGWLIAYSVALFAGLRRTFKQQPTIPQGGTQ